MGEQTYGLRNILDSFQRYGPVPDSEVCSLEGFDDMLIDWGRNEAPIQLPEPTPLTRRGSS